MPTFKEIMSQYGYNPPEEFEQKNFPIGEAQTRYARDKFLAGVESEFQKMGFKPLEQKEPEKVREKSLWDYVTDGDIVDSFAAGTGTLAKYVGHAIEEYTRPDDKTPTQWHEQTYPFVKALQTEGQAMEERNAHQYEDNSLAYHANNIVQSAPSVLAILGAAALGSTILRPVVGAGSTAAINYALLSGKARQLAWDLAKFYQGSSTAAKIARATIPTNARTLTALPIGIFGEAQLEKQGVEEESLGDAIRNGTYRKDESELKAEAAGDEALWKNAGIIGLLNAPQYKILFNNKATKGLLGKIKDTAAVAGSEAIEEVLQEIANLSALDKPIEYKRLRDAAIAGAGMGVGMHSIKLGADYIANRGRPSEEETEATFKELAKQNSTEESERYGQFREEVQNTLDQNLRDWTRNTTNAIADDNVHNTIVRVAQKYGVPPEKALAVAMAESNGNQDEISPVGAIGVMQLMPETAEGLGVDPYNMEQNIDGGVRYLKQMYDQFGDWDLAFAAYNAGSGAVERYGGIPPYSETQNYVSRINGFLNEAPEYQSGEQRRGNEGITYLGENGNAEGKYWVRNPNMNVSTEGMRPESLNALDMLGKFFFDHTGKPLILNAGTNGDHAAGEFSHANGWKFDIIDQLEGDGALITADYGRGSFLDQFVKYGRSLGLGMNFENEGTSNVHLDVAVDGTQWDGNGDHAGGFNPRNAPTQENSYDPNFTERQNEIWQVAQYASQRLRDKHGIRPAPELIYRQWVLEDGGDFTHSSRNWGGLKDMAGNFRSFNSDQEYADAYVDDFMALRREINNVTDENGMASDKDFTDVMLQTRYIVDSDYDNYINGLANISAPSTRSTGRGGKFDSLPQWNQYRGQKKSQQTSQEESKPLFDLNSQDSTTQKLLEQFANERFTKAVDDKDVETVNFFNDLFDDNSAFQNTPENRNAIINRYGDEFNAFVQKNSSDQAKTDSQQKSTETKSKTKQEIPYDRDTAIIKKGREYLDDLLKKTDEASKANSWTLNSAIRNNDVAAVENILRQNNVAIPEPKQTQPSQPQQDPVKENKPPENVLPKKLQQQIKVASAPVKTGANGKKSRQRQGNAIIELAGQNKIEIPNPEVIALTKGSAKAVQKWRDNLMQAGIFNTPQQKSKPTESGTKEKKLDDGTIVFTPANYVPPQPSLKERAKPLVERFKAQQKAEREADLTNEDDDEENKLSFQTDIPDLSEVEERDEYEEAQRLRREDKEGRIASFNAAVKKDKENNYGLRADAARQRRERYEATRVDPITERRKRESEIREDEEIKEALRHEEESRDNKAAQEISPEEWQRNYKQAQSLSSIDTVERLEGLRKEGRKQRDHEIERLKTADRKAKISAGKEVLRTLRSPKYKDVKSKVETTLGLTKALENGSVEAIRQVKKFIDEADNQELQKLQVQQAEETRRRDKMRKQRQQQMERQQEEEQRESQKADLATEEEENIANQNNSQDQQWLEEEEDENTEWVQQQRQQEEEQRKSQNQSQPQPATADEVQLQNGYTKTYHASDYDRHVVFHGRKSSNAPERPTDGQSIADAIKDITQAPVGTKIEGNYSFQVETDVFEITDRAGRKMIGAVNSIHRPVVLSRANAIIFLGNATEIRVTYPEGYEQPQQNQKPKAKRSTKAEKLHAKLKTDTHPLIKEYLDDLIKRASSKEESQDRSKAIKELKMYEKQAITDEMLEQTESNLQKRKDRDELENRKEAVKNEIRSLTPKLEPHSKTDRELAELYTNLILDKITPEQYREQALTAIQEYNDSKQEETASPEKQSSLQEESKSQTTQPRSETTPESTPVQTDPVIVQAQIERAKDENVVKAYETLHEWDTPRRRQQPDSAEKFNAANDVIIKALDGEITGAQAYNEVNKILYNKKTKVESPNKGQEEKPKQKTEQKPEAEQISPQEVSNQESPRKPKRKSKGKWHTIGAAGSREDLQQLMKSHGMTVEIKEDGTIVRPDGTEIHDKIRVQRGRWQYGYYEDVKQSKQGNVDTRIENFVDDKDLTPQQKLLQSFGEKLGVKVKFFDNEDGDFHGAHSNGTSYINVNSKMPIGKVFWHESMHWLKANNPKLYQSLVNAAGITNEQRDAYLERTERDDLETDAAIDEEIIADQFEDVAERTGLLQSIAGKNRGLIERVVQWLKDTMNKFISHFRNPDGKFTTEQSIRLADEFGKIASRLIDANGQKIFRYNRRTHNIELADGRNLNSIETEHSEKRGAFKFNERPRINFKTEHALNFSAQNISRQTLTGQVGSGTTQVSNTVGTYKKAIGRLIKLKDDIRNVLDYGAGKGLGAKAMLEANPLLTVNTLEPFPDGWTPDFTVNTQIKNRYDAITNLNVLNVVEPKLRDNMVRDIGTLLNVGGKAIIGTRGWTGDIANTKNPTLGDEPHSVWITKKVDGKPVRVYQKGFDGDELRDYVSTLLGEDFKVEKTSGICKSAVIVTRIANSVDTSLENKKAATNGGLPEGYRTESGRPLNQSDAREFIVDKDGNRDMGEISKEIEQKTNGAVKSAPVRLQIGIPDVKEKDGFGYLHIVEHINEIKARGFNDIPSYIKHILENFNKIYQAKNNANRIILYCKGDKSKGFMPLDLILEKGRDNYYRVVTAYPRRRANKTETLLFDELPTNSSTATATVPHALSNNNESGVVPTRDNGKSNVSEENIPQGEDEIKYSFAGKKAKTADKDSLNRAMAMDERGLNRDQIYRETGWVKGKDDKWRFEIPDNLDRINLNKLARDGKATVGEIYNNPKLYVTYPQLKNMRVIVSDEIKSSGNFNPSKNTITLNKEVMDVLPDRAKQTLVHELQHAIQKIEGFAFGSGKSNFDYKSIGGEQEAREVAARADMSEEKRRTTTPTIHDENAIIIFHGEKYTVNSNQRETPNDENNYSIDSNDNSTESLTQKIQNKFAAWWNGDAKKNRNKEITDLLYRTTGYKVDFGNVKDADKTIIDDVHKVIRAKHAYEWEKLLPQIGGKIAKTLKLNPTEEMNNYIADWCMTGAVGNRSAEAKAFEKAMHDDPITAGLMLQIRDAFQEFNDMTADEKIGDTIVSRLKGKSPKEIAKTLWGEKEEQITDDLHPVLRQVNEMITKAEKTSPTLAKLMKEDINPYQMMRLLRGVGGLGDLILHANAKNIEDVRNQFRALYPSRKFDRLVSLDMIIDMAGGKNHDKGLIDFAVAKLDKEMHEKLRANPNEDIRPQFSEAVDDEIIKAGEKQYSEAHRALVTYSNILACIQYDAGLLTDSQFRKMMKGWKNYIPMIRVFDEEEDFKFEDSLKHKTGSQRSTYNPLETLTQNTYDALSRAERNKAKQQFAFYARIGEFGDIIQEVETSNPGKNIIHYRENGEMKYLKVFDPAVKRAVDNIYTPADTSWIMKFLKSTMSFVRSMYTQASFDFSIGNLFRDMQDAYIHNRHADANPFVAMLNVFREGFKGFGLSQMLKEKSLVPHDTDWVEFNALGGAQSTFVSEDVDQLRRSMNKLTRKTFKERFKENKLQTILESMQWLSEQTEYMTRLNSYKRAKAELAKQRPDGKATLVDKKLAALEARDASIDFAKAGTSTRKFNRLVMFANAQVQDWAKWGVIGRDYFKGGEAREIALQKIGRLMLTGVLATLLQAALNYSDDDRRDKYKRRPDWEKETYWIFGDGLRIPKGQDIGTRFVSALTDEFIDKAMDDDPVSAKRILKVIKNATPSIIPSLIEPVYEVHMNYSSFRDAPIVPFGQQNLDKAEQYGKNTSSFAKLFGELTGWTSPRAVDYLISSYLGSTGKFVSRIPDFITRGATLDDVLMLRRFVFDPNENTKTVKDYYEAYNEQYKHYNTYKLQRKWDRNAKLPSDYDPKLYARLKSISEPLRKISAAENNILRNPKLDWDTKNKKLRELEKKREQLCEKIMRQAR